MKPHQRAVRIGTYDYVAELFGRIVGRRHSDRIGEIRFFCGRFGAELAAGNDFALRGNRPGDIGDRQAQIIHLVGFDPYPHRVRAAAEYLYLAHAVNPGDTVFDVEHRVVRQERFIVAAVGGKKRQYHDVTGRGLLRRYPLCDDCRRKLGGSRRYTVLCIYGVHVGVRTYAEGYL